MTCFSIQKFLILALALAVLSGGAFAQDDAPAEDAATIAQETKKKQEDEALGRVEAPIVVELFTTTNCSQCVFADRILYEAMKEKNVIALSCHVKDMKEVIVGEDERWSKEKETSPGPMDPCIFRQWTYKSGRLSSDIGIRIPNFVINGSDQIDATSFNFFNSTINKYKFASANKAVDVFVKWKDRDTIDVHLPQSVDKKRGWTSASVWIIRYKDIEIEKVNEGINKGRVLRFSNVIQSVQHIGKWHGQTRTITVDVPPPQGGLERGGYVVLVQEVMGEPVLAAGKLVDYPHPNDRKVAPVVVTSPTAPKPAPLKTPAQ